MLGVQAGFGVFSCVLRRGHEAHEGAPLRRVRTPVLHRSMSARDDEADCTCMRGVTIFVGGRPLPSSLSRRGMRRGSDGRSPLPSGGSFVQAIPGRAAFRRHSRSFLLGLACVRARRSREHSCSRAKGQKYTFVFSGRDFLNFLPRASHEDSRPSLTVRFNRSSHARPQSIRTIYY